MLWWIEINNEKKRDINEVQTTMDDNHNLPSLHCNIIAT